MTTLQPASALGFLDCSPASGLPGCVEVDPLLPLGSPPGPEDV